MPIKQGIVIIKLPIKWTGSCNPLIIIVLNYSAEPFDFVLTPSRLAYIHGTALDRIIMLTSIQWKDGVSRIIKEKVFTNICGVEFWERRDKSKTLVNNSKAN